MRRIRHWWLTLAAMAGAGAWILAPGALGARVLNTANRHRGTAYRVKVVAPRSVTAGQVFAFSVSGFSAKRSQLAVLLDHQRCARSAQVEANTHHFAERDFKVRGRFGPKTLYVNAGNQGGRQHICAYLLKSSKPPLITRAHAFASYRITGVATWTIKHGVDTTYGLRQISCPSQKLCVAYDDYSGVVTSTDPRSGTAAHWAYANIDGYNVLNGLACASSALCVAVDQNGNVLTSTKPGAGASATWTTSSVAPFLYGMSCPSASLCVTTDGKDSVLTSTDPSAGAGATWTTKMIEPGVVGQNLAGISCPTTSLCVAIDDSGNAITSTDPGHGAAATWTVKRVDTYSYPVAISCVPTLCAVTDFNGNVITTPNPGAGRSARWAARGVSQSNELINISCESASLCVATDGSGSVATSTDPAAGVTANWTVTTIDPNDPVTGEPGIDGISCPSASLCLAVDGHGSVLTSTDPGGG